MEFVLMIVALWAAYRTRRWVRKNPLEARVASRKFQRGCVNLALFPLKVVSAPLRAAKKILARRERSLSVEIELLRRAQSPVGRSEQLEEVLLRR